MIYRGDLLMSTKLTPIKAIRAKCLDCVCGNEREVRECKTKDCSLWNYRMGTRDATKTLEKRSNRSKLAKNK